MKKRSKERFFLSFFPPRSAGEKPKKSDGFPSDFSSKELFCGVYAYLLFVAGNALEFHNAVDKSIECVVTAFADIVAGADVCASLSYDDVACKNRRTVGFLNSESLRVTVAAVLCRTNTFFMCEKLQAEL